jgi:hypothetical protein
MCNTASLVHHITLRAPLYICPPLIKFSLETLQLKQSIPQFREDQIALYATTENLNLPFMES